MDKDRLIKILIKGIHDLYYNAQTDSDENNIWPLFGSLDEVYYEYILSSLDNCHIGNAFNEIISHSPINDIQRFCTVYKDYIRTSLPKDWCYGLYYQRSEFERFCEIYNIIANIVSLDKILESFENEATEYYQYESLRYLWYIQPTLMYILYHDREKLMQHCSWKNICDVYKKRFTNVHKELQSNIINEIKFKPNNMGYHITHLSYEIKERKKTQEELFIKYERVVRYLGARDGEDMVNKVNEYLSQ